MAATEAPAVVAAAAVAAAAANKYVELQYVNTNNFVAGEYEQLEQALRSTECRIEEINLLASWGAKPLGDLGLAHISQALKTNTTVKKINLTGA
eukprot:TRINITY_DN835_c0_g1_i2.p1 TRINITY_DN835_c0_g1~~TRINITY_DN835_c0_g1_i2.p1  ORF type:complete len:109 (-),score=45.81 TRINITY_DN835_c0_g1_i2:399-680(-)